MRNADFQKLLSDLPGNDGLRQELHRVGEDLGRIVAWVEEKGYRLTREEAGELVRCLHELTPELTDDELDAAAGGAWNDPPPPPPSGGSGGSGG